MGIRVTAYIGDWVGSPSFDTSFILWSNCLLCKEKKNHNISCLFGWGFFLFYFVIDSYFFFISEENDL